MINIQNLTFGYSGSKRNVFSQFNLQMKPGSVYGLLGKNGTGKTTLLPTQMEFATSRRDIHNLREAMVGADVFLGLSAGNLVNQDMVRSMADQPIVFALANPTPEISYEDAMSARPDVLMCTGRSDYPNQINNVIVFPYIFRGALDVNARAINEEMKIAAVRAIVALAFPCRNYLMR